MAFIPGNITRDHVLQAIEKIDGSNLELNAPTRWNVEINGKKFPPKEVMRYAHEQMNGEKVWEYGGGKATNSYLEKMGFSISDKNEDPVKELIRSYKTHVRTNGLIGEVYKWQLLNRFKGRPDTNAANFYEEIKAIDFGNLIYPVGISVVHHIAKDRTEQYRDCFRALYNEQTSLEFRIKIFSSDTLKLYRQLIPEEKFSHHQDERTMATFLAYHNPDVYPFYKDSFYQKYCRLLGIKGRKKGDKYVHYLDLINEFIEDYIVDDLELIDLVNKNTAGLFSDPSHKLLAQDILYQSLDKRLGALRNYWRVGTTDDKSSYWEDMKADGKICIGWPRLGDLNEEEIKSKEDVAKIMRQKDYYKNDSRTLSKKAREVFHFYNDIKVGDVAVAQNGMTVLAIGIVADEYDFEKKGSFPHQMNVSWSLNQPNFSNREGLQTTIHELKDPSLINKIDALLNTAGNVAVKKTQTTMAPKPLNQILFGPPGTGKTYTTINKALEITGVDLKGKSRKDIKKIFDAKLKEGQIVFTTFHQSLSYEDFIEGIKPETIAGKVTYNVEPGIFMKVCENALTPNQVDFNAAYNKLKEELGGMDMLILKTPTGKEFSISLNNNDNLTLHTGANKEKQGTLTKENIQKQINGEEMFVGWNGYFRGVITYLETKYNYSSTAKSEQNFVLIIDEINRGNVSQIFGELITLIEEDKRIGRDEALTVTLPYSKKSFGVPANLHIIGTMNTADRSVEALDAALRRRFSFVEMQPSGEFIAQAFHKAFAEILVKHHNVGWEDVNYKIAAAGFEELMELTEFNALKDKVDRLWKDNWSNTEYLQLLIESGIRPTTVRILDTVNQRLEKLLDKDHRIGHSYFMKVTSFESLQNTFQKQVIPLLQEYFFGDYGKIGLVLGEGFVRRKEWDKKDHAFADFNSESADDFDDKEVYEMVDYSNLIGKYSIKRKDKDVEMSFEKAIQLLLKQDIA